MDDDIKKEFDKIRTLLLYNAEMLSAILMNQNSKVQICTDDNVDTIISKITMLKEKVYKDSVE